MQIIAKKSLGFHAGPTKKFTVHPSTFPKEVPDWLAEVDTFKQAVADGDISYWTPPVSVEQMEDIIGDNEETPSEDKPQRGKKGK